MSGAKTRHPFNLAKWVGGPHNALIDDLAPAKPPEAASNAFDLPTAVVFFISVRSSWRLAFDPADALVDDACAWLRLRRSLGEYKGDVLKGEVRAELIAAARRHNSRATASKGGGQ